MEFAKFSKYLLKLEETSKRLEIIEILKDLVSELETQEVNNAVYLTLGQLKASYENQKFNIADKMLIKTLELAYENDATKGEVTKLFNEMGDLGNVAEQLASKTTTSHTTIQQVYTELVEIATLEGSGSQQQKVEKGSKLLKQLDSLSAKYVVRIILGTMRLGFSEVTICESLALLLGDKKLKKHIENKYNIHPDIGLIAKNIKSKGLNGLDEIQIEPGIPIEAQKAQRVADAEEALEKIPHVWAEYKFDGTRVQLHLDRNTKLKSTKSNQISLIDPTGNNFLIKTFTRNLEETTHQYPDIIEAANKQINATSIILDGEAIGYDRETGKLLMFQETIKRKRKHGVAETANEIPLKYFVFDILYLNGESLIDKPLKERRQILSTVIQNGETIVIDEHLETEDADDLGNYFEVARKKGLEGLVVKNPNDPYQAGARSYSWVKMKKSEASLLEDSVDCIVLGYYFGKGARSKLGIGGFLVGVIDTNTDEIKTITKIGTGLTDEEWVKLKNMCDILKISAPPGNILVAKRLIPDVWAAPKIVVEVTADEISVSTEHTALYALRFPRLLKFRDDKNVTGATSIKEIEQMYAKQKKISD